MKRTASSRSKPKYKRILLKLSGEALGGDTGNGICPETVSSMARQIGELGNSSPSGHRGGRWQYLSRIRREGAASTEPPAITWACSPLINALALQNTLEQHGVETRVQTAIEMSEVAEPFIRRRAVRHLEKGRVVIFGGGTGNPYFTTDTAAALRANEIGAEVILKATKVDGIYDSDPEKNPKAKRFREITYLDCLQKQLRVLDSTAFSLCLDNKMPIVVFDLFKAHNIRNVVLGKKVGTLVKA